MSLVSRTRPRRRSRFAAITSLWPLAAALLLLAATLGFFWTIAREVTFERRPLPTDTPMHAKK